MSNQFQVSVIVPVYNSEQFLEQAVQSALDLPQVGEIVLVEDGSSDQSLAMCRRLEATHTKVVTHVHPENRNLGAGASRNLGLDKAKFPYLAFLDADDYYLPNRFERAKAILSVSPQVDGVWEAVGTEVIGGVGQGHREGKLTTIRGKVPPERLFSILIRPGYMGHFQTNGITFRKRLLERTGKFDPELRLHQDTHLWIRMAYHGTLVPGTIDRPVAIRRVHDNNRIAHSNFKSQALLRNKIFEDFINLPISKADYRYLVRSYLIHSPDRKLTTSLTGKWLGYASALFKSVISGKVQIGKLL